MKRIFALFVAILTLVVFASCTNNNMIIDEEYYNVQIEAFYDENGERLFSVVETFGEESIIAEYNNIGYVAYPGSTISDVLSENYAKDLKIVDDNETFEGWMVFKESSTVDADGFENTQSTKLDGLYTTEEILEMEVVDCSYRFVAMWSDIDESYYAENGYEI